MFHLHDVCVSFGACHVLETGDLSLEASSAVALMGPNGSGKTTLLRVLSGLQKPTSGHMTTDAQASVGFVCQHHQPHTYMPMTVSEVLSIGRYRELGLLRRLGRADKAAIHAAAERLNVDRLASRPFGELSGGQRQRVMVAMALASESDCLLLDEPISGLDLPSQKIILEVIADERAAGRLVVMSTHHLQEARRCDRVLLLRGIVLADGPPAEVLDAANLRAAFGGEIVADSDEHEFVMESSHAHEPAMPVPSIDGHHGHHHDHDHADRHAALRA